jgi:hypothetical protein
VNRIAAILQHAISQHGRLLLYIILIRVIHMCLHLLGIQKKENPALALLWATWPVLVGEAGSVGRLSQNSVKFQELGFSLRTWDLTSSWIINSGVGVSWTDAFWIIYRGPVCRSVEGLRSSFPRERQLIGKCKNVETSLFSKWANGGSRGRQLVTEAGGPEVSAVSERATST